MKYRIIILFVAVIASVSCKYKEQKAAELIRNELSKTLYDFGSYEPIETVVTEAYDSPYNNPECFRQAKEINTHLKKMLQYVEEAKDAVNYMEIWGAPTYYSSSYSDRQYYKYKSQAEEIREKFFEEQGLYKTLGRALQDSIKVLDSEKIIGWEVRHKFRCKTRGELADIENYRYIVDKQFKNIIIFCEDMDDDDYSLAMGAIALAEQNGFDKYSDE